MAKLRAVLKRRWPVLLICLTVGVIAGVVSSSIAGPSKVKLFTAKQVVVANPDVEIRLAPAQDALKVTRGEIPKLAAKTLGGGQKPAALAAKMGATYTSRTNSIAIATNDTDPKVAEDRVNAFADAFLEVTNARLQAGPRRQVKQVEANLKIAEDALAKFDQEHPELTGPGLGSNDPNLIVLARTRSTLESSVQTIGDDLRRRNLDLLNSLPYDTLGPEDATPFEGNLIDVPATKAARGALIGMLGLLLGGSVVLLVERVGRRIDTREELVEITDLPILAEIGKVPKKRMAVSDSGKVSLTGIWAEPYRRVRSAIQFVQANGAIPGSWHPQPGSPSEVLGAVPSVFLVTSTSPAEGKSTTSSLVAMALAEVGVPTVLIGGDFRKPQIDRLVGANRSPSLQDLASLDLQRPTVDDVVQSTEFDHLYVAAAGGATREVAGLVEAAKEVCMESVRRGATVIIDSSPLQAANDTLDLLPAVDYVILVLRAGKSGETDLLDTIATLRRMESNLLGIVLIGTPAARKQEYYYDYYSHGPSDSAQASA